MILRNTLRKGSRGHSVVAWGLLFLTAAATHVGEAQIVLDGKFGTSGALAGPNFNITAAMGATRGNNLFHSFAQFDLGTGDTASFSGPNNIRNILCRVTGGSASSINGTLRSSITGANLFLINPSGILFGPNATVNVTGSFAASTANYLQLADGARFVASLDADDSGLSTAPVSAFGFLGNSPASITVQHSAPKVPNGQTLSLVGGDVAIDGGTVQSAGGQINVVSVRSEGQVPVDPGSMSLADFNAAFPQQGRIDLINGAGLDASGTGGGRIVIRGGQLTVENSRIEANTTGRTAGQGIDIAVVNELDVLNGGQINSLSTAGLGVGGNISLTAQTIRVDGGGSLDTTTQISAATGVQGFGGGPAHGGDIVIRAGSLELAHGAEISCATFGAGDAGRIEITASSVRLDNAGEATITQITANTEQNAGGGQGGDVVIRTGTFDLLNGATILATTFGTGSAGVVDIVAESANLLNAGIITAGTFGSGSGGNVQIKAGSMRIDGTDTLNGGPDVPTGIRAITTSPTAAAPGGSVRITADSLVLDHLGSVSTTSSGRGPGGDIEIVAGQMNLANHSTLESAGRTTGRAGKILVNVAGNIGLAGGSSISTSAPRSSGGDIEITAGNEIQLTDSQITAQAGPGGGGSITLAAPSLIYLLDGTLTAQATGNGGNLTINGPVFFILNNGDLISKSSTANGGNITILSDYFFQSESVIDASAPFGLPGTVSVSAPDVDLSGSLVGLPSNLLGLETQLRPDCGVRLTANVSSFVVLGRGGLPLAPGGFVPSGAPPPPNEGD